MANEQNLRPGEYKFSHDESVKGGKASGEARRRKREIREMLEEYLSMPATVNGQQATRKDVMVLNAVRIVTEGKAKNSDFLRAFELIRDTIGEQPVQKVEVDTISPEVRAEMDTLLGLG